MRRILCFFLLLRSLSYGASLIANQPGTALASGTWVQGPQIGYAAQTQIVGYSRLTCAEAFKSCIILENHPATNSEYQHAMLNYSFATGRWDVLDQDADWHTDYMWPANHPVGYQAWNPLTSQIYYWGSGACSQALDCYPYTFWTYDLLGRTGHPIYSNIASGSTDPASNQNTGMEYDPIHQVTVLYDGQGGGGTGGSVYEWGDSTQQWVHYSPTTSTPVTCYLLGNPTPSNSYCPTVTYFPATAYNPVDGYIYLFGGSIGTTPVNALWKYWEPTHTFTELLANGITGNPSARGFPTMAWDSKRNLMLMVSGCPTYNTCAGTSLGDTWIYDPSQNQWTQQSPASTYTNTVEPYYGLSYDEPNDVFVLATETNFAPQLWFYRIDPGSNYGYNTYTSYSYPTASTAYSFNYSAAKSTPQGTPGTPTISDSWARNPSISVNDSNLYECHPEYGRSNLTTNEFWPWPYCTEYSGSTPISTVPTSSSYTSIAGTLTTQFQSVSNVLTTVVPAGTYQGQWVAFDEPKTYTNCYNGSPGSSCQLATAGSYNGTSWSVSTIPYDGTALMERPAAIASCNNIPTLAIQASDRTTNPYSMWLYVKQWNGTSWANLGGQIYHTVSGSTHQMEVFDVSLQCDSSGNPWIAWNEAYSNSSYWYKWAETPQVYVAQWNGSAWVGADGTTALSSLPSLNNSSSNWATDPSLTLVGTTPYVAWGERSQTGPNLIYTKTWNGSAWVPAGANPVNRNTNTTNNGTWGNPVYPFAWATHARVTNDGTNVWATWTEQTGPSDYSHVYVSEYVPGTGWRAINGAPAANQNGSAANATITMYSAAPLVAWDESGLGLLRQVYAAKYSASSGAFAPLSSAGGISVLLSCPSTATGTAGVPYSSSFAANGGNPAYTYSILSGSLPAGLSLNSSSGLVSGSPTTAGSYNFVGEVTDSLSNTSAASCSVVISAASPSLLTVVSGRAALGGNAVIH